MDIIISTYLAAKTNKQIKKQINRKNRRKKQEFVFERGGMGGMAGTFPQRNAIDIEAGRISIL